MTPAPLTEESERLPIEAVRVSMARVVAAWGFGAMFFNLTAGAVYAAFARKIGADERVVGLLFSALPLMSFLQVVSALMLEKAGKRKRQMVAAGLAGRSLWLFIPLLPLLPHWWPERFTQAQMLPLVIGGVLLSSAFQAFTGPPFFSWMADLVPARVRPSFFAQRMRVGTTAAMIAALAGGAIADKFPTLPVYCALLVFAGFCGMMDIALFLGVREPPPSESNKETGATVSLRSTFGPAWRDPHVRQFLLFVALVCAGYGVSGPLSWLFVLEHLSLPKTTTSLLLNILPLLGIAISSRFWGGVIKRHGNRPVVRICSLGLTAVPIAFMTAQTNSWLWLGVVTFLSGIAACGIELTNHNRITGLAPHIPRGTMAALFSITAGTSMAVASMVGGQIAHSLSWLGEKHYEIFGVPVVNYHVLFALSMVIRLINTTFVAPRMCEPASTGTLDTVKEIVPEMFESFTERLSRPIHIRGGTE